MLPLNRILFATDFSSCAGRAREMAALLSLRFDAELHILHVIHDFAAEVPQFVMGLSFPGFADNVPARRQQLQQDTVNRLRDESRHIAYRRDIILATRFGTAFVEIVRYARGSDCDLILMGSHGRSGIVHAMLGSVAERVVRKAHCPVLTVRETEGREPASVPPMPPGIHPLPAV